MNYETYISLFVFIGVVVCFLLVLTIIAVKSAYHNGVRDGYQNTWLPHVQEQIREEGLYQGKKVNLSKEL